MSLATATRACNALIMRYSVYLLFQHQSTNSDAAAAEVSLCCGEQSRGSSLRLRQACASICTFVLLVKLVKQDSKFWFCFCLLRHASDTQVVLSLLAGPHSVYLLYQYKSTNTDAESRARHATDAHAQAVHKDSTKRLLSSPGIVTGMQIKTYLSKKKC